MIRRIVAAVILVTSCLVLVSNAEAVSRPRGAVELSSEKMQRVGKTMCGFVRGRWVPGTSTTVERRRFFVTFTVQSSLYASDAKRASGNRKKELIRLSEALRRKAASAGVRCRDLPAVASVVQFPTTTAPSSGSGMTPSLRFNLGDTVALALTSGPVASASVRKFSAGSNLRSINSSGTIRDAVTSGRATIKRFLIAPNDKLYVVFGLGTTIDSAPCILAEINKATGVPLCVETDQEFVFVDKGQSPGKFQGAPSGFRNFVNDFQFDETGAIFYLGVPSTRSSFPNLTCCENFEGNVAGQGARATIGSIIRRYSNGKKQDFGLGFFEPGKDKEPGFSENMSKYVMIRNAIANFLVLPNGDLLIDQGLGPITSDSGRTFCNVSRLDLWKPDGKRIPISAIQPALPMMSTDCRQSFLASQFASDPNVRLKGGFDFLMQLGTNEVVAGQEGRLYKINAENASATAVPYVAPMADQFEVETRQITNWCGASLSPKLFDFKHYFCGGGTMWRGSWRTPEGHLYAIVGQDAGWPGLADEPGTPDNPDLGKRYEQVGARYGSGVLMKVRPSIEVTPLGFDDPAAALNRIEAFLPLLGSIVAAGTDTDGQTRTVLYNTNSKEVTELIAPSEGIRPLQFAFNGNSNSLFFSGLRVADKSSVVGKIDLATRKIALQTGLSGVTDLQAFAS